MQPRENIVLFWADVRNSAHAEAAIPLGWVLGIAPAGFTAFGREEQLRLAPKAPSAQGSAAPAQVRERIESEM